MIHAKHFQAEITTKSHTLTKSKQVCFNSIPLRNADIFDFLSVKLGHICTSMSPRIFCKIDLLTSSSSRSVLEKVGQNFVVEMLRLQFLRFFYLKLKGHRQMLVARILNVAINLLAMGHKVWIIYLIKVETGSETTNTSI